MYNNKKSFFGTKEEGKKAEGKGSGLLRPTGGYVDQIVVSLLNSANDADAGVKGAVAEALKEIGIHQPALVLSTSVDFIQNQSKKMALPHRVAVLATMADILDRVREKVPEDLSRIIITFAAVEMTTSKEIEPTWQDNASRILVSICVTYPDPVFEEMITRFEPGVIPHYFVIKTISDCYAANPVAFVPRLKEVLARVLPILGNVKFDNLRWVIAAACSHFAEAVLSYTANTAPGKATILVTDFQSEFYTLFEVLFQQWLQSSEIKVRLCTAQALGNACALLSQAHFDLNLPKVVKALTDLYKREKEQDRLAVTSGLLTVLQTAVAVPDSNVLEPHLRIIAETIFPQGDPSIAKDSAIIKNYNEVLRCFEAIGKGYVDQELNLVLKRLEIPQPPVRVGCIYILKHLVSRLNDKLKEQDRRPLILAGIIPLIADTNINVRKAFSQLIIAMAAEGYLSLEGGEKLVEFVVRNSSVSEKEIKEHQDLVKQGKRDPSMASPQEMKDICSRMLDLMTTTIPAMEKVLWPYLLEVLIPGDYREAMPAVCRSIAYLGAKKKAEKAPDYLIDFDKQVNLPKPQAIIARLMVALCGPKNRPALGERIIEALLTLTETFHPSIPELWDAKLPKILAYLKSKISTAEWDDGVWCDLVLRLLSETIDIINDDEWNVHLGEALSEQMPIYKDEPQLKKQALRLLGLSIQKSTNKQYIRNRLEFAYAAVDYNRDVPVERAGVAECFGLAATTHLDMTLEKLTKVCKEEVIPKSLGFFSGNDKSDECIDRMKTTALLCYGRVTASADPNIITSRVDMHILTHIIPIATETKSHVRKDAAIQCFNLMATALHPSKLAATQQPNFTLKPRDDLIKFIIGYMQIPKDARMEKDALLRICELRLSGLVAMKELAILPPVLPGEMETQIIKATVDFNDVPDTIEEDLSKRFRLALNDLFGAILSMTPTTACLGRFIRAFEAQVVHAKGTLRERACESIWSLLKKFLELLQQGKVVKTPEEIARDKDREAKAATAASPSAAKKKDAAAAAAAAAATAAVGFGDIGLYIAMLIPRTSDPEANVRDRAMRTLQTMLFVDYKLANPKAGDEVPPNIHALTELRTRLKAAADAQDQYACIGELAKLLAGLINGVELPVMLQACLLGLSDTQDVSATGTAVVINGLIRARGAELAANIPTLVDGMLKAMEKIKAEQAMNGVHLTIRTYARHHLVLMLDELIGKPIPHSVHVMKALQTLAKDEKLAQAVTDHLLTIINNQSPYDEKADAKGKGKSARTMNPRPASAVLALGEIFDCPELKEHCSGANFPSLCMTLLLRFGVTVGLTEPQANKDAQNVFEKFLTCTEEEGALREFKSAETLAKFAKEDAFHDGVAAIVLVLGKSSRHKAQLEEMYQFVFPFLSKLSFPGYRIGASSIISEFITFMEPQSPLLGQLVNCLLARLADDDETVKLVSLRGLGNVAVVGKAEVDRYSGSLLNALMTGMDNPSENLAMMSMTSLARIFELVDEQQVAPVIVNLSLRLKPIFEKTTSSLRAAAFTLFGTLSRFGGGYGAQTFLEQIHANLTPLIVHLNDEDDKVKEACRKSLKQCAPLFKNKSITAFFDTKAASLDYESFLFDFSKLIVAHSPDRLNFYFAACSSYYKSSWNIIRANAAIYCGYLVRSAETLLDANTIRNLSLDHVSTSIIATLKDQTPSVRIKTAQAMALMYDV